MGYDEWVTDPDPGMRLLIARYLGHDVQPGDIEWNDADESWTIDGMDPAEWVEAMTGE